MNEPLVAAQADQDARRRTETTSRLARLAAALKRLKTPISVVISAVAIILSIGTTITSALHARRQEFHDLRAELRSLLQRLSVLQRDNAEAFVKYAQDPVSLNMISGAINQENSLVAKQARDIARQLGGDRVSSVEYLAISNAFFSSSDAALAREMALLALERANASKDFYEGVFALRGLGTMAYGSGDSEEGRVRYAAAETLILQTPLSADLKNFMLAYTYLGWCEGELSSMQCNDAIEHHRRAVDIVSKQLDGPPKNTNRANAERLEQQLRLRCSPGGPPTGTPPSGVIAKPLALPLSQAPIGQNNGVVPVTTTVRP